ncbi:MAG: restriction endonuclease [Bacteroidia bacterium]|nr:restriction endonuclease [Bacteroidia bacterium]
MKYSRKHITVFEHQAIKLNQEIDGVKFEEHRLKALQSYYGEKGLPYFSLIHNGVRFNEYVGVIQVGDTVIEVLPKADNSFAGAKEKKQWRDILIDMLFAVGVFDIHAPSSSALKLKSNSILDLYFELFIKELEYLLHNGLVKQYRKKEGNVTALKGSLQFGKHIQQNLTHQERFYVRHTTYDVEHKLHFILYKTIRLLKQINTNTALHSQIGALMLHFPEMPDVKITEATFDKLVFTRKTQSYKKAIDIAKLLLLQYHPDVSRGRNNVLALMFDMNKLWEQFVYASLRKHKEHCTSITAQTSKFFWKHESGYRSKIRPDIVVNKDKENCVVLDTKWKNLNGYNPSPDDLRQMYVYHDYYNAKRVALIYPGIKSSKSSGAYLDTKTSKEMDKECSVISLSVEPKIKQWQRNIYNEFENWLTLANT